MLFPNPLATPPPDVGDIDFDFHSQNITSPRPRLELDIRPHLLGQHAAHNSALAFDPPSAAVGISSPAEHPHAFRYARDIGPASASVSVSAVSGGDSGIYSAQSTLEHSSDPATGATTVSGYPCSPPPSRHHSEHGSNRDKLSGASQLSVQSPADSPASQAATSASERLNLNPLNAPALPDHYHALSASQSEQSEQQRHLSQTQQQEASVHLPHSSSSLHSPSDRYPPLSTMLSTDRYRMDRYPLVPPGHERRISDPSEQYSSLKHYPSSMNMGSGYAPYTLHRVTRSGSYSDIGVEPGLSHADWQDDEREHLYRDERTRAALDPYSPIHSSSFSSNSSLATPGLHSPHAGAYHHPSRGYPGPPSSTYHLYGSDDAPYDGRPQSSSGDSNSPSYAYTHAPSGSRPLPNTLLHHQDDFGSYAGDPSSKTYSFVSLPGNAVRKRPRRRYDEIERLYSCNFSGCTKAYGTLNHLNAHVNMQKHGAKRHPNEFKEMRKQWRKMKKEQELERERMVENQHGPMTDVLRRRRATDPNTYGIHSMGSAEDLSVNGLPSGPVAASVSDPLGMSSLDVPHYGLGSGLPMNVSSDPMGAMGVSPVYGQHHYPSAAPYQQRAGLSPISPVSPAQAPDAFSRYSTGGQVITPIAESPNNYYPQAGEYDLDRSHTPPPRNQLPPNATLCSAFSHSAEDYQYSHLEHRRLSQ